MELPNGKNIMMGIRVTAADASLTHAIANDIRFLMKRITNVQIPAQLKHEIDSQY